MRKGKPLTQQQLASAIGKSRMAVHAWEKGYHPVPVDMVDKIVEVCVGVPMVQPANAKLTRATIEAYAKMRADGIEHDYIAKLWAEKNFIPTPQAQAAILEAFPDIHQTPKG